MACFSAMFLDNFQDGGNVTIYVAALTVCVVLKKKNTNFKEQKFFGVAH